MPNDIYRFLYKKLLALYPRAFREHFGDSMRQTFDDMCRERRGYLSLGFITWVAAETSFGIARERFIQFRKRELMENAKTNFALSALVGFLFILPFMILAVVFDVAPRLATYSTRNAIDLIAMFTFVWIPVSVIAWIVMPLIRRRGKESDAGRSTATRSEGRLTKSIANPLHSAIISLILALPFLIVGAIAVVTEFFNIPPQEVMNKIFPEPETGEPNLFNNLAKLSIPILAIAVCYIARAPVVRAVRSGGSLFAHPFHLILVVVILCIFASFVLGLMMDQFPCWIGVPNCD